MGGEQRRGRGGERRRKKNKYLLPGKKNQIFTAWKKKNLAPGKKTKTRKNKYLPPGKKTKKNPNTSNSSPTGGEVFIVGRVIKQDRDLRCNTNTSASLI